MKFEQIPRKKEEPIDGHIYERYQAIKLNTASLKKIDAEDLENQKNIIFTKENENPYFFYKNLENADLELPEQEFLKLKQDLKNSKDENPELHQAYIWKINEQIAKVRMFKELQKLQQNPSLHEHARRYKKYIEFIYGKPDPAIFLDVIKMVERNLEHISIKNIDEEKQEFYTSLQTLIRDTKERIPSEKDFDTLRPNNPKERQDIIIDIEIIKEMFEEKLKELNLENEWTVIISDKKRSSIGTRPISQQIILPNQEGMQNRSSHRAFTPEMIRGLIEHEIGTHALRKQKAKEGRFRLLEIGLDRYEEGEEGVATYREHQETGATDFAGLENYLVAGLTYGLDSGETRNFSEVFNIMTKYYSLIDNIETHKAQELAWNRCLRFFKGTPGNISGLISLKDTVYRKGNIATYELMKKDGSEKIDFNIGKFNPANTRHINVLVKLGILDSDLETLDS